MGGSPSRIVPVKMEGAFGSGKRLISANACYRCCTSGVGCVEDCIVSF